MMKSNLIGITVLVIFCPIGGRAQNEPEKAGAAPLYRVTVIDRTVSADAAGIILTSLVINRQLWLYHDSGDVGLTQLYRMRDAQLWRHIEFHPECNAIYAALD